MSSVVAYIVSTVTSSRCETTACRSWPWHSSSSLANGRSSVRYLAKISRAPCLFGLGILTFTSNRPVRNTAGSMRSCRLLAPMTITFLSFSTPSISAKNCGTIVDSISEEIPDPRVRNNASISSKNTTTGLPVAALSRALAKTSRMYRSDSPTYLFRSSGPFTCRK